MTCMRRGMASKRTRYDMQEAGHGKRGNSAWEAREQGVVSKRTGHDKQEN